jgi:hypothetical protein
MLVHGIRSINLVKIYAIEIFHLGTNNNYIKNYSPPTLRKMMLLKGDGWGGGVGGGVGIGEDPGFNTTTVHQKNPNYRPFRKHLRSR